MSPRPRGKGNIDLPLHVETSKQRNGSISYRYKLPTGERASLGQDRDEAIAAAKALNAELSRNPNLVDRVLKTKKKVEDELSLVPPIPFAINAFKAHLNKKVLAVSTREEQDYKLNAYQESWSDLKTNEVNISHVSGFLETKDNNSYVKHRILLIEFWSYLTHRGWAQENVAEKTMRGIVQRKKRKRHTSEALDEITRISPDWLQRAINLARHSVQRRGDLVLLHRNIVDLQANTIIVKQAKTANYALPVFMQIDMHPELREAVVACLSDKLAFICPYLLHYKPLRLSEKTKAAKPHHLAITQGHLTKEFKKYRDLSGVYDHLIEGERPTLHEIRALGMYEIEKKYGKEYSNALAGHSSMKMTEHYLEGHEPVKPVLVSFKTAKTVK